MKSYLDLVPISAKVHRKQNRMSIICIVLAVFLVTAIFGMADMFIRGQILQAQQENGNWHIGIQNISDEDAMLISSRPEVATVADYGTLNFRGEQEYTLHGKNVSICGGNESIVTEIFNVLDEGTFPKTENEAMISINAKDTLKLKIGEQIVITTPNGTEFSYIISGFMKNSANLMREDVYGVFLTTDGFRTIYSNETDVNPSEYTMFFVLFDNKGNIPKEIAEIKEQYGLSDKQVTENITLLGLMGQSDDSFMAQVYTVAIILFFLVLMAGVLMIASSMNTNVAQRTEFFGMVRCIGATPKQVMQLVRKEVMNWCRFAIPLGVIGGMVLVWVLCFILRQLSPQYFGGMPAFMDCVTESEQFFMCRNVPMPNLSNEKIFPGGIKVKVLFAPDVKWRLVEEFGPHCFTRTDDGRLLFSADYTDMENLVTWLMTFGAKAEVLEPKEARDIIRRNAEETLKSYGGLGK